MEIETPAAAVAAAPLACPLSGARADARSAVLDLLSSTGFSTGGVDHDDEEILANIDDIDNEEPEDEQMHQIRMCTQLLDALERVQSSADVSDDRRSAERADRPEVDAENLAPSEQNSSANDGFIRTNMEYNNKCKRSTSSAAVAASTVPPTPKAGVRDALVNLPSSAMSNIAPVLSHLLADRVDATSLLPATQDVRANLEAMGLAGNPAKKSMTISKLGLLAGRVYAELIAMPGAWGAGLIDAAAVSALSALVRRWSVECRGREPGAADDDDDDDDGKGGKKKNKKKNARKRGGSSQKDAGNKSKKGRKGGGPRKRKGMASTNQNKGGKKNKVDSGPVRRSARVVAQLSDSEYEDDSEAEEEEELVVMSDDEEEEGPITEDIEMQGKSSSENNTNTHSEQDMVMGGLRLALSLAKVPTLREFINWSSEAREALLDAVTTSMACAAALLASPSFEDGCEIRSLCASVVDSLSDALQNCVLIKGEDTATAITTKTPSRSVSRDGDGNINNFADAQKAMETSQETAVFVLRGLMPLLSLHVELPMGQKGKVNAHDVAASVLEGIIFSVSEEIDKYDSILKASTMRRTPRIRGIVATPHTNRRQSSGSHMTPSGNKTPKTDHKRRKSVGMLSPVPPSLKKTVTPSKSSAYTPAPVDTPDDEGSNMPRPILSTMLGLMQKLATAKGLERAQVRARAVSTIKKCLPRFPALEQSHFLRFVTQLCHSKVAFHRLFAVELVGEFLSDDWIWKHYNTEVRVMSPPTRDTSTMSPALRELLTEPSIPVALLKALHDRLSDRAPAVRARAAHSLSDSLGQITKSDKASESSFVLSDDEIDDIEEEQDQANSFKDAVIKLAPQLISTLRKRAACDERATVRKASIAGLTSMLLVMDGVETNCTVHACPSQSDIVILSRLCGDQSVATRKAAAEGLTTLLKKQYSKHGGEESLLESAFAEAVLPLVLDAETTCVTKAVDIFCEIVLDPIIEVGGKEVEWNSDYKKNRYMTAWRVLAEVSEASNESGASKGGIRALKVALSKVFDDAGASHGNASKPILKELHRVAVSSLELDGSSHDDMNETLTDSSSLFSVDVAARRVGAWCLLDALTDCGTQKKGSQQGDRFSGSKAFKCSSIDSEFLASSWEKLHEMSSSMDISDQSLSSTIISSRQCLQVMSKLGSMVSASAATRSAANLKRLLATFDLPPDLVGSAISALISLSKRLCDDKDSTEKDVHNMCKTWVTELYSSCETKLESFVKNAGRGFTYKTSQIERAIFTAGELSLVGFATDEDAADVKSKREESNEDPVRGLRERPSSRLINLIQLILPSQLPPVDGATPAATPQTARALAFVTIGKLCLRDERLAKDCLNILARELNQESAINDSSVQSNVLLVLGDLCIKYTNLVDKFLPVMASCLQSGYNVPLPNTVSIMGPDPTKDSIVRKHAVLLLSSLVLQDYIKWRGLLVHRFLAACVDDDIEVSHLAETTLCGPLLSKQPNLFFNNFVEAIFVLNNCTAHKIYAAAQASGESGSGIAVSFEGIRLSKRQRMQIYRMMLGHMSDEEKIGITARLAKEVLAGALESDSDLRACIEPSPQSQTPAKTNATPEGRRREKALNVMSDCFAVLTSPSARVGRSANNNDADEAEDVNTSTVTNGPSTAQLSAVRGRLLSKISRKHLIDTVVPILCRMKGILEKSRSPLLKDLMRFFVEIYKLNKNEVKELLASDPDLLREVEWDLKQFEKSQRQTEGTTPSKDDSVNETAAQQEAEYM